MAKIRTLELPQEIKWNENINEAFPEINQHMKEVFYMDHPQHYKGLILKQDVLIVIAKE